jgi:hypothetical protein
MSPTEMQKLASKAAKKKEKRAITDKIAFSRGDVYAFKFKSKQQATGFRPNDGVRTWKHEGAHNLKSLNAHGVYYHFKDIDGTTVVRKQTYFMDYKILTIHYYEKADKNVLPTLSQKDIMGPASDTDSDSSDDDAPLPPRPEPARMVRQKF